MCKVARKYLRMRLRAKTQSTYVYMYFYSPLVANAPWRMCTLPFNLRCCLQYITHTPCIANATLCLLAYYTAHCFVNALLCCNCALIGNFMQSLGLTSLMCIYIYTVFIFRLLFFFF